MGEWYYAKENEKIGPVEKEELLDLIKQKVVKGEDLVWTQGVEGQQYSPGRVTSIPHLFSERNALN